MRRLCIIAIALALGSGAARAGDWGTRDYVAAGVPDLGQPWSTADLRKAVDAITRAVAGHPERLPRYHSPSSGAVFAKLLEPTPLDRTATVDAQVTAHFERYRPLVDASTWYRAIAKKSMPHEWLELTNIILHEAVAMEQLSGPFLAALAPGDSRLPDRRAMVAKLRDGTGLMLMMQLVVAIGDNVAVPERIAALHNLTETAPTMLPVIPAKFAHVLRGDVPKLAGATTGALHDAAVRLQRAIATAP